MNCRRRPPKKQLARALIQELNQTEDTVHGILVQLPLPAQIDEEKVIPADFGSIQGRGWIPSCRAREALMDRRKRDFYPCTPAGVIQLLKRSGEWRWPERNCVIVGRSNIVGKPMAALLMLRENATVTDCTFQNEES